MPLAQSAANAAVPEPIFSVESGIFAQPSITVALSSTSGVVHVTFDGSIPTIASPVYTEPFTLGTNVIIKARVISPGYGPGPVASRSYQFLDASAAAFNSNLPILVLSTGGRGIPNNVPPGLPRVPGALVVIDTVRGRSSLQTTPQFIGLSEFEIFGQTSAGFPKLPYTIEVQDEYRNDRAVSLLGMPAEADWKLRTLYNDKTFLNEVLALELFEEMGHYSVRRRLVEVFVDTRGDRISYPADYVGIMALLEKIEIGDNRVALQRLRPEDNSEPEISGGYIWKKEKDSFGDLNFATSGGGGFPGQLLKIHDPKPRHITTNQVNWLRSHLNRFEQALYASDWRTATGTNHYSHYIDVDSFVDQHWIVEFTKNIDGYRLGNYMRKDRGGKIQMDLLWDWELSFGNADYLQGGKTNGWYWSDGLLSSADHIWLRRLLYGQPMISAASPLVGSGDPEFIQKVIDRWGVLRTNILSAHRVLARVDELSWQLTEAATRDFARYPRLGQYIWPNPNGGSWDVDYVRPTNYAGILAQMKKWIHGRYTWIDRQFVRAPQFNHPGGSATAGFNLVTLAEAGAIYYTLDGTDPRATGGGLTPSARVYSEPITIDQNTRVRARARLGTAPYDWSPPASVTLVVQPATLRITEMMYHARSSDGTGGDEFDYLELKNIGPVPLELGGMRISGAVEFTFPATNLGVGQFVVVVKNHAAFASRYGDGRPVAGEYIGTLDDAGGRILLQDSAESPILEFSYDDAWLPVTDGLGFSLVLSDPLLPVTSWGRASSWRPSAALDGSPGKPDPEPPSLPRVVISEAVTHAAPPGNTAIELQNLADVSANLAGWFLTDNSGEPRKFRIPADTVLAARGFRVFTADAFGSPAAGTGFLLSPTGGEIHLFSASADGALTGYSHDLVYGPQLPGVSFGRHLTSAGEERFVAQNTVTLGSANLAPRVGPVIISEIMYHPPSVYANGAVWDNLEHEYIELFNMGPTAVDLFDTGPASSGWSLTGSVQFVFAPNTSITSGGFLVVVNFDPATAPARLADFRIRYSLPATVAIVGPYRGSLANQAGEVTLVRPAPLSEEEPETGLIPQVLVEQVHYADSAPWPAAAAGGGFSLNRREPFLYADDASSWELTSPSPGGELSTPVTVAIVEPPQGGILSAGTSFTFVVRAVSISPSPIRYQWRFDGLDLPGATNSVLIITNVGPTHDGTYTVVCSDGVTSVESPGATLTVLLPPTLAVPRPPVQIAAVSGDTVTLGVQLTGTLPIYCRWRLFRPDGSGVILTNQFLSERTAFVTIPVLANSAGAYTVILTNSIGGSTTVAFTNAILTVLPDSDGDRLPDIFEEANGLNRLDPADGAPTADADGDGSNNRAEYIAGTDPQNPGSFLKVSAGLTEGAVQLEFGAVANRTYAIQQSDSLNPGSWQRQVDFLARTTNRVETVIIRTPEAGSRFYRLVTPRSNQ